MVRGYTGLHAIVPRVLKFCVANTSTVSEPRTAATATTAFPRFRDGAAFGTYESNGRRRACLCSLFKEIIRRKSQCLVMRIYMPLFALELTFADLHAF